VSSGGSIPFDRAADIYDETRGLTAEASAATTDLLRRELEARQPCLEIGVGTGLIGLPLHRAGIRMVGVDLSAPMLGKLVEKAEGRLPFPLIVGDATRLPFADDVVGAALARHVLHLIPLWQEALTELVRVVQPRGVLLIDIGFSEGPWQEIGDHLDARIGETARRVGLDFSRGADLDDAMAALGARVRELPTVSEESELTMERYFGEVEAGVYSWTWNVPPDLLADALAETRAWAAERFGG